MNPFLLGVARGAEVVNRELPTGAIRGQRELKPGERVAGVGRCQGTLGELFQGPIVWGTELEIAIVSLPFSRSVTCEYVLDPWARAAPAEGLDGKQKTAKALELLLASHGLTLPPGRWRFSSQLEVGKGMASSTADIVAAMRCVASLTGHQFQTPDVMNILRQVERSDSVFLDEAALYLSERHEIVARFGSSLNFTAAYMVEHAVIDTEAMRDCLRAHYQRCAGEYRWALDKFLAAAARKDPYQVAEVATESSKLSQRCLPKRRFAAMRSAMRALAADGIFVAHTGSVVGYLYVRPPSQAQRAEICGFFESLGESVHFDRVGWTDA
ncbi:MAG: hypothetical protein RL701_1073 [Pseudomonadota bacterium]|jgi:uncharacterized protein involved in propanediol utilization